MAAKAALSLAQQQGGLSPGQTTLAPAIVGFLKSHLSGSPARSGPGLWGVLHRSSTNRTDYLLQTEQLIYFRDQLIPAKTTSLSVVKMTDY